MIDGSDGVVASASPKYLNDATKLPIACLLEFDTADVEVSMRAEEFISVLTHEIGHCLGLGTMWEYLDLVDREGGGDYVYRDGTNACREWREATGCDGCPPVESNGPEGFISSHWDQETMPMELMTGKRSLAQNYYAFDNVPINMK